MKTISIKSTFASDYKMITANGAFGGITPKGEIFIEFFIEKPRFSHVLLETDDSGNVIQEKFEENVEIIRELQLGLLLRADVAEAFAKVLTDIVSAQQK